MPISRLLPATPLSQLLPVATCTDTGTDTGRPRNSGTRCLMLLPAPNRPKGAFLGTTAAVAAAAEVGSAPMPTPAFASVEAFKNMDWL
jgi:hypothetical protein